MLSGLGLLLGGGYVIGLWILSGRRLSFLARDYRWEEVMLSGQGLLVGGG